MGQTLTHGIYLPDEGERNCYNGLAANWQLLDNSVGTIAEHTTALSGKAPLVHTHGNITNDGKVGTTANKPLITGTGGVVQAGSFGTAANTFCEGNDSRLSDARTPVAHTHGKADITDLFNSVNTWTGDNSFSKTLNIYNSDSSGTTPALHLKSSKSVRGTTSTSETDSQKIAILDKNGNTVSENITYVYSAGSSWIVNAVYTTDSSDNVISSQISHYIYKDGRKVLRSDTNTDLGTSTNQWNNLYAKNYYYNGVAWGLDTFNQWTGNNKFVSPNTNFGFQSTTAEAGSLTPSSNWIYWQDKNGFQDAYISRDIWSDGSDSLRIAITSKRSNGAPSTSGTEIGCGFRLNIHANGNTSIDPFDNGGTDLGTSTNKWKTLNGINPGALSLPDNSGYTNISGNITNLTGSVNSYTPPSDGYVMVNVNPDSNNYAYVSLERITVRSSSETTSGKNAMATIPVIGGKSIDISVIGASIAQARFTPCLGNV